MRHEFSRAAMGVAFRAVIYAADRAAAGRAEAAFDERLAHLAGVFDMSRDDSELARLHAGAGGDAVRASDELYRLLARAARSAQQSGGGYDLTAGAYAELWQQCVAERRLPAEDELAAARALVGRDKLALDAINRTVRLTAPGVRLDLAGVLPGHACDRLLAALQAAGAPRAMVDGGSRVATGEPPPGQGGWLIDITNAPPGSSQRAVRLARAAMASSGRVGDLVEIGGTTYSRQVHPLFGVGSKNVVAVTVMAPRASQADALARAAQVVGQTDARTLFAQTQFTRAWFHYPPGTTRPATTAPAVRRDRVQRIGTRTEWLAEEGNAAGEVPTVPRPKRRAPIRP